MTDDTYQNYCNSVVKEYNRILMTGLPERQPNLHDVPLDKVFIKLNVTIKVPLKKSEKAPSTSQPATIEEEAELERLKEQAELIKEEIKTLSLDEALFQHRYLLIRGAPGSGKTTLLRWLAVTFARQQQAQADHLGPKFDQPRLPILLELRRFGGRLKKLAEDPAIFDLATEIADYFEQDARFKTEHSWTENQLKQPCILLLDGLDEIAEGAARQRLLEAVDALLNQPDYQQMLCILTTRPHGFQSVQLRSRFQQTDVKPFELAEVTQFIQQWYRTAYEESEDSQQEANELIAQIETNQRITELATNPLLCTIIAIYRNNRVLPNRRVDLYLKCCEALLDTWERNKYIKESGLIGGYDWQTKLELLMPVAYWLHEETERLAASEEKIVEQLTQSLKRLAGDRSSELLRQEAQEFVAIIRDRSGLLQGRGDGTLEFSHRTFREYLAARYIASQPNPVYIDWVMAHLHEAWWREVHLLVIGHLRGGRDQAEKAEKLMTILEVYKRRPLAWLLPWFPLKSRWIATLLHRFMGYC